MSTNIVDKVIEILKKYSLCDRCLGRLFGYLGRGMSNLERGRSLKTTAVLEIHRRLQDQEIDLNTAKTVILNTQKTDLFKTLGLEGEDIEVKPCFICENMLDKWIEEFSQKISSVLLNLGISSFIVGVTSAQDYLSREELIAREFGLTYKESVKREIKREIGKRVSSIINAKPDFSNPEVVVVVDLAKGGITLLYPSTIFYGYYWKYGRLISQNIWVTKEGRRKYELSIEDAVRYTGQALGVNRYRLHVVGREDADVRALGSGRPIAIEFKILGREANMELVEKKLNEFSPWLKFEIRMKVNRDFISRLKEGSKFSRKIYRAIVYTSRPIKHEEFSKLETVFNDRIIVQRTPTRILRRKKDKIRRRKVYQVKVLPLSPQLFEVLIDCEGGLYAKELISGDKGRTRPSFAEVLGCDTLCLMLDVLYVHEHI